MKIVVISDTHTDSIDNLHKRVLDELSGAEMIIHGHSHRTKNDFRDGVLWFNPGSATGRFPATKKTYGILTINKEIRGELITL